MIIGKDGCFAIIGETVSLNRHYKSRKLRKCLKMKVERAKGFEAFSGRHQLAEAVGHQPLMTTVIFGIFAIFRRFPTISLS